MSVENIFLPEKHLGYLKCGIATVQLVDLWVHLVVAAVLQIYQRFLVR